jgi:tetratricopeptide (TPR) repeat protein
LLQLGDVQLANGDATTADTTLARSALTADIAKDDVTRARALTRQLYAVGYVLQSFDRAAALDAQAASVIDRLGGDDELAADRLQAAGMIALARRDLPAALESLDRAVALREKVFGPRGRRVAMSRHSRCLVYMASRAFPRALDECSRALEIWREAVGPAHPDVSLALKNRGRILVELGRAEEGCRDLDEALAIEEASLDADHPTIAGTLLYLADCRAARGDTAGALTLDLRALAIREKKLGPTHAKTKEAFAQAGAHRAALR